MAYLDLSSTFIYKSLLTHQQMDGLGENDKYFQTGNAAPTGDWAPTGNWAPTGAWTFTPGSAVVALTIDQNNAQIGEDIDCSIDSAHPGLKVTNVSTTNAAIEAYGNGRAGVYAQGATFDFQGQLFYVKPTGHISLGGNEALIWDVVEFNLDGTATDTVAYTLDGLKCKGMYTISYDVNTDDLYFSSDIANAFFTSGFHDGANLGIDYGANLVAGDDARVIIFTTV